MTTHSCPYFRVYLAWHPKSHNGQQLAEYLFRHICGDPDHPLLRGLGIPVHFRSAPFKPGTDTPKPINLEDSLNSATFVLVDDHMVISESWQEYIEQLWAEASKFTPRHRVYPVALTPASYNLSSVIARANFIRIYQETETEAQRDKLLRRVLHECCRQLKQVESGEQMSSGKAPPPVQLFLSHAKQDGVEIAKGVRQWIEEDEMLTTFFDAKDIGPGYDFREEIEAGLKESALLICQTDAYATRHVCRWEVLTAKKYRIPALLVSALKVGEERSFPYLGNAPTLCWQGSESIPTIITRILLEVLRYRYFPGYVETLKQIGRMPTQAMVIPCAPELLSQVQAWQPSKLQAAPLLIYPEPPLGDEEIEVLNALEPGTKAWTPSQPMPMVVEGQVQKLLSGKVIGISISNSPDLERQGFGDAHLKRALIEISRHLIAQGANVAYGGDLRPGGFTQDLVEMVKAYNMQATERWEKIQNFLAWPLHLGVTVAWRAEHGDAVSIHAVPLPEDLKQSFGIDEQSFLKPHSTVNRYVWVRCLTAMREQMAQHIDARIILGGQVTNYKGAFPGIAEEAALAIAHHKPLFVLGAFGGCARAVGEAMLGHSPEILTQAYQTAQSQDYAEMLEFYNQRANQGAFHDAIDYTVLVETFQNTGFRGMNNGLTESENQNLFDIEDLNEMVYLVLKGLQS
ncbi:TIR domain-containing protein [Gloeocapsa sp. PCC 73106]|uniref:TIR domain-containing protein n=1 Tax=Gloeocapsa sp. PCC 73106 TaxID=102232 RepID=UPI0002F1EFA5|nr:TIR domain-containing protein [Gloeocapsa sp. PCC 73106]